MSMGKVPPGISVKHSARVRLVGFMHTAWQAVSSFATGFGFYGMYCAGVDLRMFLANRAARKNRRTNLNRDGQ